SLCFSQVDLASLVVGILCCSGTSHPHAQIVAGESIAAAFEGEVSAPPRGAGVVETLQADQDVYTNHPASVWCPACVTNVPPCMLPCYLIEEETAAARFTFQVTNQYPLPRTFQFSSSQQFDLEIVDNADRVVASWSDGKFFMQSVA